MVALCGEMAHDLLAKGICDEDTLQWLENHFLSSLTYFQNTYPFNLQSHSSVRSHCLDWLTGDPDLVDLQNNCVDPNEHLDSCKHCLIVPQLFMIMMGFCNLIEQNKFRNDLLQIQKWRNRINDAHEAVREWQNFIIRNKVSEEDWASRLSTEHPEVAQATFDFAMDHLPEEPK